MSLSRADNSGLARWWWTVDRVSLMAVLALMAIGLGGTAVAIVAMRRRDVGR